MLSCGHTLDKVVIEDQFNRGRFVCPSHGCALERKGESGRPEYKPNYKLKDAMEEDMKRQPEEESVNLAARLMARQQEVHANTVTPGGSDAAGGYTVGAFLSSIGLGEHIDVFREERWDNMAMLTRITHADMGNSFNKGKGVEQDFKEAARYYRLAADQGNAVALYNLGLCYCNVESVEQGSKRPSGITGWLLTRAMQMLRSA